MKVMLLVLAVLAVAFAVVLGLGAGRQDTSKPRPGAASLKDYLNDHPAPPWARNFGALLKPFSPRLKLDEQTFRVEPLRPLKVPIPEANARFRTARFRVPRSFCRTASITYQSFFGQGHAEGLDNQKWEPSKEEPEDPASCAGSLVILQSGGQLTLACPSPCVITLE